MKDYSKLKTELLEKIAASKKAISASAMEIGNLERSIGDLVLEEFKETNKIDFDSLVTCYQEVYRVTKFEVVGEEVMVFGRLHLPGDSYSPTVMLDQFDPATEDDLNRAKQRDLGTCDCKDFDEATQLTTDSGEYGACFVYDNGEWFTGKTLPAVSFCPWCGKRLKNQQSQ